MRQFNHGPGQLGAAAGSAFDSNAGRGPFSNETYRSLERDADRAADNALREPVSRRQGNGTGAGDISPSGAPLDAATRSFFERRMNHDFSGVRVHAGTEAAAALGAKAFTTGKDVFFARGRYDPGSAAGRHLIAHELAHVVQQSRNGSSVQCHHEDGFDPEQASRKYPLPWERHKLPKIAGMPDFNLKTAPKPLFPQFRTAARDDGINTGVKADHDNGLHRDLKKGNSVPQLPKNSPLLEPPHSRMLLGGRWLGSNPAYTPYFPNGADFNMRKTGKEPDEISPAAIPKNVEQKDRTAAVVVGTNEATQQIYRASDIPNANGTGQDDALKPKPDENFTAYLDVGSGSSSSNLKGIAKNAINAAMPSVTAKVPLQNVINFFKKLFTKDDKKDQPRGP